MQLSPVSPEILSAKKSDPYGDHRPAVLVSHSFLDEHDLDDGQYIGLHLDSSTLICYLVWNFNDEPPDDKCYITDNLRQFLPTGITRLNFEPATPPDAQRITLGPLVTGGITMSLSTVPQETKSKMDEEVIDKAKRTGQTVHVGLSFEAEAPAPDGVFNAARYVRKVAPPLVARVVAQTQVILW